MNKLADIHAPAPTPAFRLYLWPQRLLVLAPAFAAAPHRHHAAQIVVAPAGAEYQTVAGTWQRAHGVVVPPDVPHAHRSSAATALLFLEAESAAWRHSLLRTHAADAAHAWSPSPAALHAAAGLLHHASAASAQAFCTAVLGADTSDPPALDPRVLATQDYIAARLDTPLRLAAIARHVHLSSGRLAHLFRHATGITLRRYILWRRLRTATEAALRQHTLTEAAHRAGFADAAHLSRTFRAMFGIPPSLLTQGAAVEVLE